MLLSRPELQNSGELGDRLHHADAATAGLFADVIGTTCRRFPSTRQTEKTARIERLIGSGAWTDAAMALIELELSRSSVALCGHHGRIDVMLQMLRKRRALLKHLLQRNSNRVPEIQVVGTPFWNALVQERLKCRRRPRDGRVPARSAGVRGNRGDGG